ncbi:MAG: ATP-binding protein [Christensenella sp.]|nr:ATP-binding protein [Christensenella sp.]
MINDRLDNLYARIRAEEREAREQRLSDAYARAPRLKALDEERAQLFFELGKRAITAEQSKQRLAEIFAEEQQVLASLGLPKDALELHVRCALCNDTGYLGQSNKPCSCRLLHREAMRGSDGVNARETFGRFLTDIFPTPEQKKRTINAKLLCEQFSASLPNPEKPNILLFGMPGLGKSFLGNAIAFDALSRGIDAERVTAYAFIQAVLQDIREQTQRAARYQTVPLLVLDDLGSEPVIPNVSFEWLFAVINERTLAGLATVCSTNYTLAQLQQRYDDRFMSRLCDKNTTLVLHLTGENLRTVR